LVPRRRVRSAGMAVPVPSYAGAGEIMFNIGVDIELVERFSDLPDQNYRGLFTSKEREYCLAVENPATRLAGTWCAKEAVVKALWPWVRLDPRRVAVSRDPDGQPVVDILEWDAHAGDLAIRVSISHCPLVSIASAIAWGPPPGSIGVRPEELDG
jgi:holo-[acyl-carrier protein] synthase